MSESQEEMAEDVGASTPTAPASTTSSDGASVASTPSVQKAGQFTRPSSLPKPSGLKPPTKIGRLCSNSAPKPAVPISPRTASALENDDNPLDAKRTIERKSSVESPAAPVNSPLTPLLAPFKDFENAYVARQSTSDIDSPAAPPYSPLTPLVVKNNTSHLQTPLADFSPFTNEDVECHENCEDSPTTASCIAPSSVVAASSTRERENSSPLPLMSPETLKLFETLNESFLTTNDFSPNITTNVDLDETATDFSRDTDSDYVPDSGENSEKETRVVLESEVDSEDEITRTIPPTHSEETENLGTDHPNEQKGRPKRGRKRKFPQHTLAERKKRKYNNLPYHGKRKLVQSKVFKDYSCKCLRLCHTLVSVDKRQEEFDKYVTLGSYEAQLLYIVNYVKEIPKSRSYILINNNKTGKKKPKTYRRHYFIGETEVCKDMFVNNFQISSKKIDISLKKQRSGNSVKDQRGKQQGGWNKTPDEDIKFIENIIKALPKYVSHYARASNSDSKYLKLGMTVQKIYDIYKDELKKTSKKPVSLSTLKRIFYSNFNLRCKTLKKDTCNRCDTYHIKLKNCTSAEEFNKIKTEKEEHIKRAQDLREEMNRDLTRAKTDNDFECITFDLEKTLPLPRIPTNVVFYKRQLWVYNCGIHVGSTDTGICNVWVEGEASRGAQEVGSCLVRFIKTNLDNKVKNLVLWSDCCGGQNRNIKIVIMLKAILNNHSHLETISFKYLESGHTFLPNDTDFSKIEYQLKFHERVYTVNEYINIMKVCKKNNPLQVYRMQKTDFLSTSRIEKNIVNRKIFKTKEKVNWLKTKEIVLKKDQKHTIFMKGEDKQFRELNLEKKFKKNILEISEKDLTVLWPNGKEIAQAKLDDLHSMLDLIPKDCIDFYKSLKGNVNIEEDVDGIDEPDYEIFTQQDYDVNDDDD